MRVNRNKKLHKKRILKQKNPKVLKKIALALAIVLVATVTYVHFLMPHTLEVKQRHQLESTQLQLQKTRNSLQKTQAQSVQEEKTKQDEINKLNQQLQDTESQLQAKKASPTVYAAAIPATGSTYCGSDPYLAQIYQHESGCCPTKWQGEHTCPDTYYATFDITNTSIGYGLCQSTPAIKMAVTGSDWATNWATQDSWCRTYAIGRYGSTAAAWSHWQLYLNW